MKPIKIKLFQKGTKRSASITLLIPFCLLTWTETNNCTVPVLLKVGMVPRERALQRRPGREEGESLHLWEPFWCLMSLERLGGGVGTKESARSGDSKGGWQLKEGTAELPARYLQHKGNVIFHINITKLSKGFQHYRKKISAQQQKANSTNSTVNAVNLWLYVCQVSTQASYHSALISIGCEHFINGDSMRQACRWNAAAAVRHHVAVNRKATGEKLHINTAQLCQISGKHSPWHVLRQSAFYSVAVKHHFLEKQS